MRNLQTTNPEEGREAGNEETAIKGTKAAPWVRGQKPVVTVVTDAEREKGRRFRRLLDETRAEELERLRDVGHAAKEALLEKEKEHLPGLLGDYLGRHPRIDRLSRAQVVRGMSILARRNKASRHAFFLGVQILDRALRRACGLVDVALLARMGTAALLIAVKYEHSDTFPLDEILREFVRQEPDKRGRGSLELEVLSLAGYDCRVPTPLRFLEEWGHATRGEEVDRDVLTFAATVLELGLYWHDFQAEHPPSLQAYATVAFVCHRTGKTLPKPFIELAKGAGTKASDFVACFEKVHRLYRHHLVTSSLGLRQRSGAWDRSSPHRPPLSKASVLPPPTSKTEAFAS